MMSTFGCFYLLLLSSFCLMAGVSAVSEEEDDFDLAGLQEVFEDLLGRSVSSLKYCEIILIILG